MNPSFSQEMLDDWSRVLLGVMPDGVDGLTIRAVPIYEPGADTGINAYLRHDLEFRLIRAEATATVVMTTFDVARLADERRGPVAFAQRLLLRAPWQQRPSAAPTAGE